jgi:hypothetical protein
LVGCLYTMNLEVGRQYVITRLLSPVGQGKSPWAKGELSETIPDLACLSSGENIYKAHGQVTSYCFKSYWYGCIVGRQRTRVWAEGGQGLDHKWWRVSHARSWSFFPTPLLFPQKEMLLSIVKQCLFIKQKLSKITNHSFSPTKISLMPSSLFFCIWIIKYSFLSSHFT